MEERRTKSGPGRARRAAKFKLVLTVTIRRARLDDLPQLEWFGTFAARRPLIARAFTQQEQGSGLILVADCGGAPLAQVWIDFAQPDAADAGFLWAVHVFPWFQRRGVGTQLMRAAEATIRAAGRKRVELTVERTRRAARRFYEALGYRVVASERETYRYRSARGTPRSLRTDLVRMAKVLGR